MTIESKPNALAKIAEAENVSLEVAMPIINDLMPYYEAAQRGAEIAKAINVTDAADLDGMEKAREIRLKLKAVRVGADKVRKGHKDVYLRVGNCIQGAYNAIAEICEEQETRLEAAEKFAVRVQEQRKAKLKADREVEISPFIGVQIMHYDLANMPADAYAGLLAGAKLQHEAKLAEEAKAAKDAADAAAIAAEEDRKIREENAKLKELAAAEKKRHDAEIQKKAQEIRSATEAAAAEARKATEAARIAEAQRKAAIKAADDERNAREKLQAELDKRRNAETQAALDKKLAEQAAAAAPDREKLLALAESIRLLRMPECTGADAKSLVEKVRVNMATVIARLEGTAK